MKQGIFLVLPVIILLAGCKSETHETKAPAVQAIPVGTAEVQRTEVRNDVSVSGNIEGNTTVRLGFMVSGKINHVAAREGQMVKKGQLLASLDPASYQIAHQLAEVQVNAVSDEYNRLKLLHDKGNVTDSDFSKAGFSLQQARLQQQLQQKNENDCKLYTPISGVLLKKLAENGEMAGSGMPVFVVSDISRVKVLAYIPEGELHLIRIGQPVTIAVSALDKTFDGRVVEVGSAADVTTRAFTVKIEVNNPGLLIRPGMIAEARIHAGSVSQAVLLPAEAVVHDLNNQAYVFVVDKNQKKAYRREISVGKMIENKIEILKGVSAGETVVTAGQQKLADGSAVTIK